MVGTTTTAGVTGVGGVFLTTLFGTSMFGSQPVAIDQLELPLHSVNVDKGILATWVSEEVETFDPEPLDSECQFYNFSRRYDSSFCDAFTISRMQTGTVRVAAERALRCAAKAKTECVLSPEIGLAIPAAFVAAPEESEGLIAFVAPRVLPLPRDVNSTQRHVRVATPSDMFFSRTVLMNDTLKIEYMTSTKELQTTVLTGDRAFCVNLLRAAFEKSCWEKLDG